MPPALWRAASAHEREPRLCEMPPSETAPRYRLEVFGEPRAPWRASVGEVVADAIRLELASWDASRGEHYLAVPVDIRVSMPFQTGDRHASDPR